MKIPTDDIDVFVLRSLIALKLIRKKDLEDFYRRLAKKQFEQEELARIKNGERQNYYGA
jgi:hypothetical protein